MFNLVTASFFGIGGASVFSARLVTLLFSLLSLLVLFELSTRLYNSKVAIIATVFFASMPGVLWVSRFAYIETMLEFFFLLSLLLFFSWFQTNNRKTLLAAGFVLGLGFLVKYQMLVAGLVMAATLFAFGWTYFRSRVHRLLILFSIVAAVAACWFLVTYLYAPGTLNQWLYAISAGDQLRSQYSTRYPTPIFYLIEMPWAYFDMHPVSLLMYAFGLSGLAFLLWRRKPQDRLMLVWFAVVYIVFTAVGNRQWRYVMPLFPVLAISASILMTSSFGKIRLFWQKASFNRSQKMLLKIVAAMLVALSVSSIVLSGVDAFQWISKDQINIPMKDAVDYVSAKMEKDDSLLIVCPYELFSKGIASFYFQIKNNENRVFQYPDLPVDTFTPNFSIDSLMYGCQEKNVKYILVSQYQLEFHFFNSTLTPQEVTEAIFRSGKLTYQTSIGKGQSEILVFSRWKP